MSAWRLEELLNNIEQSEQDRIENLILFYRWAKEATETIVQLEEKLDAIYEKVFYDD